MLIVLSYALLRVTLKPQPVIVVPGATAVDMFLPGKIPDRVLVDFGRNFVATLGNFTPATADAAFSQVRRYMSPRLLSQFDAQAQEKVREIKENQLSQVFSIVSYKYSRDRKLFRIVFAGERAIYVGKYETEKMSYQYTVEIAAVEPTETNPYGLAVASLEQGEAKEEAYPAPPPPSGERKTTGVLKRAMG